MVCGKGSGSHVALTRFIAAGEAIQPVSGTRRVRNGFVIEAGTPDTASLFSA
jgi:hypothetical protein